MSEAALNKTTKMARPKINKKLQKKIAVKRIDQLFDLATQESVKNNRLDRANRLTLLARKLAMKLRLRLPIKHKRRFCKKCYTYLSPSKNARIRTSRGKVVILCFNCKHLTRIPYLKEKKQKKNKEIAKNKN